MKMYYCGNCKKWIEPNSNGQCPKCDQTIVNDKNLLNELRSKTENSSTVKKPFISHKTQKIIIFAFLFVIIVIFIFDTLPSPEERKQNKMLMSLFNENTVEAYRSFIKMYPESKSSDSLKIFLEHITNEHFIKPTIVHNNYNYIVNDKVIYLKNHHFFYNSDGCPFVTVLPEKFQGSSSPSAPERFSASILKSVLIPKISTRFDNQYELTNSYMGGIIQSTLYIVNSNNTKIDVMLNTCFNGESLDSSIPPLSHIKVRLNLNSSFKDLVLIRKLCNGELKETIVFPIGDYEEGISAAGVESFVINLNSDNSYSIKTNKYFSED